MPVILSQKIPTHTHWEGYFGLGVAISLSASHWLALAREDQLPSRRWTCLDCATATNLQPNKTVLYCSARRRATAEDLMPLILGRRSSGAAGEVSSDSIEPSEPHFRATCDY